MRNTCIDATLANVKKNEKTKHALAKFIDEQEWAVVKTSALRGSINQGSTVEVDWHGQNYDAKIKEIGYDVTHLEAEGAKLYRDSDEENEDPQLPRNKRKRQATSVQRKKPCFKIEAICSAPPCTNVWQTDIIQEGPVAVEPAVETVESEVACDANPPQGQPGVGEVVGTSSVDQGIVEKETQSNSIQMVQPGPQQTNSVQNEAESSKIQQFSPTNVPDSILTISGLSYVFGPDNMAKGWQTVLTEVNLLHVKVDAFQSMMTAKFDEIFKILNVIQNSNVQTNVQNSNMKTQIQTPIRKTNNLQTSTPNPRPAQASTSDEFDGKFTTIDMSQLLPDTTPEILPEAYSQQATPELLSTKKNPSNKTPITAFPLLAEQGLSEEMWNLFRSQIDAKSGPEDGDVIAKINMNNRAYRQKMRK